MPVDEIYRLHRELAEKDAEIAKWRAAYEEKEDAWRRLRAVNALMRVARRAGRLDEKKQSTTLTWSALKLARQRAAAAGVDPELMEHAELAALEMGRSNAIKYDGFAFVGPFRRLLELPDR